MGEIYSLPYVRLAPNLSILVCDEAGVGGFAVGAADTFAWETRLAREIWPALRDRYRGIEDIRVTDPQLAERRYRMIHCPSRTPATVTDTFPAHMHLNLLPRLQGQGIGRTLCTGWIDMIADHGVTGIHVGVNRDNTGGVAFWRRMGFDPVGGLGENHRTVWLGRFV
jgi:GNAT superfamily N-acetyltransferase